MYTSRAVGRLCLRAKRAWLSLPSASTAPCARPTACSRSSRIPISAFISFVKATNSTTAMWKRLAWTVSRSRKFPEMLSGNRSKKLLRNESTRVQESSNEDYAEGVGPDCVRGGSPDVDEWSALGRRYFRRARGAFGARQELPPHHVLRGSKARGALGNPAAARHYTAHRSQWQSGALAVRFRER